MGEAAPVQKLPNLVPICNKGPIRLVTSGCSEANFSVAMRTRVLSLKSVVSMLLLCLISIWWFDKVKWSTIIVKAISSM